MNINDSMPEDPEHGDKFIDEKGAIHEYNEQEDTWNKTMFVFHSGEKEYLMEILKFYKKFVTDIPEDMVDDYLEGGQEDLEVAKNAVQYFIEKFGESDEEVNS